MSFNVQNWIEQVKAKPENIRQRYMVGCVATSMFFVVIVWSLTVTESFKKTNPSDIAETTKATGGILPKSSDFSLDQILSGEGKFEAIQPKSGEEFLREQGENRTRLDPDDEGIRPKGEEVKEESETDPAMQNIPMLTLP